MKQEKVKTKLLKEKEPIMILNLEERNRKQKKVKNISQRLSLLFQRTKDMGQKDLKKIKNISQKIQSLNLRQKITKDKII